MDLYTRRHWKMLLLIYAPNNQINGIETNNLDYKSYFHLNCWGDYGPSGRADSCSRIDTTIENTNNVLLDFYDWSKWMNLAASNVDTLSMICFSQNCGYSDIEFDNICWLDVEMLSSYTESGDGIDWRMNHVSMVILSTAWDDCMCTGVSIRYKSTTLPFLLIMRYFQ